MSAIYKLSIQGIRSFDSNERETIEFGKPLTLIVGTNGSGKTTIIECLKYATTGDLPPNSKGGAFVHDPKITGEKDVRAQVKLAFTSANDVNMIVTRNIQLLVKKTTNTFKTLEGQLVAINRGERTTLSSRAAELDTQVPLYMGVPSAILDYVVFCHQEDSLWPLSEPANLKKRFDEIFQAMKYTKALDNLKTIKKDMSIDIKLLRQSVEHLKVDRDRSRSTKINISTLEQKIEEYHAQARVTDKQLNEITEQSDKLFKSNQEFQQVLSQMDGLKHNQQSLQEQISRLESASEPINMPLTELKSLIDNFSTALEEKAQHIESLKHKIQSRRRALEEARDIHNALISKRGGLETRKANYINSRKQSTSLIQKLREDHIIQSHDAASELDELVQTAENTVSSICAQNELVKEALWKELSELENSQAKEEQHLIYCQNDKEKLQNELDSLKSKYGKMSSFENELSKERENVAHYESRINGKDGETIINALADQIKEKHAKILILEDDLARNQRELLKLNEQAELNARFSLLKKNLTNKRDELAKLFKDLAENLLAQRWKLDSDSDLDLEFRSQYVKIQKELAAATKENNDLLKSLAQKKFVCTTSRTKLNETDQKIIDLNHKIKESLPEDCYLDDYGDLVREAEESYKIAVENLKMHRTTLEFNLKALEVAKTSNCCYLCQRKFNDQTEQSSLLAELQARTNTQYEETLRTVMSEEKEYLDSLRGLETEFSVLKSLTESKTSLKSQLEEATSSTAAEESELVSSENRLRELEKEVGECETSMRPIVESIIRLRREVSGIDGEFQDVSNELSVQNGEGKSSKTMEDLQVKQKQIQDLLRESRREAIELQEEKESKTRELNNWLSLIKEKKYKVNDLERQLNEKENVSFSIQEHEKSINQVETIIRSVSSSLENLSAKRTTLEVKKNAKENEAALQETAENKKLVFLKDRRDTLMRLKFDSDEFERTFASQLESSENDIKAGSERIQTLSDEVDVLTNQLAAENRKLHDSSNERKNIKMNIDLIDLRSNLEKIDHELKNLHIQNAEAQRDKYQHESARLRNLFEKLSSDNAGRMGEIKQLQNQIQSLFAQLNNDYHDVDNTYQKEWVKLQTKTLVTDDIDIYSKALDSAIMKYHSLKMQDINRIIDELWKRTYSGTDVDSIKIKSDEVTNSTRGKSYNYRVAMYKQDAELDMRGRCSAGQKVLASIIIRLALSETFGVNCGVIALDEPTTNLDEENIESLARSLSNIIEFRRHQKNFQLIVITHDEKFLRYMGAADFADHFYKVKRDDRQKSQIEWVDINKVIS
ncbi:LAME_0G02806g1_1 [Lachancea meyersii CBS 8951]|uniref:DNA repair protein RAD50 n=1 Tax=Lachancea meyersii CBS 8951 TaxID=1266667 RepID=A0A1G4K6A4_9SACH|nr:LAME_0G02806g1_1 [Lachancea meyersii CBS 8951]